MKKIYFASLIAISTLTFATPKQMLTTCSELTETDNQAAQICYQTIIAATNDKTIFRISLFRLAKLQFNADEYEQAAKNYALLLQQPLNEEDFNIALTGWINSKSFSDQPLQAYQRAQAAQPFQRAELALATARAAYWAGYPSAANTLLHRYQLVLDKSDLPRYEQFNLADLQSRVYTETAPYVITPLFGYQTDSDFQTLAIKSLQLTRHWHHDNSTNLLIEQKTYQQPGMGRLNGNLLHAEQIARLTPFLQGTAGLSAGQYSSWHPWFWNAGLWGHPNDQWQWFLYGNRAVVDSLIAVQNETVTNTVGGSIHYQFSRFWRIVGSLYHSQFSDSNRRDGLFAEATWLPLKQYPVQVLGRGRYFHDSYLNTQGYFNPTFFEEADLFLKMHRRFAVNSDWFVMAGPGVQNIATTGSSFTVTIEAGIRYQLQKHFILRGSGGYTNSNYTSAAGYTRKYAEVALDMPLGETNS